MVLLLLRMLKFWSLLLLIVFQNLMKAILWCLPQAFGIDVSDQRERTEILNVILKGEWTEENIDFECIAFLCEYYTGLDLFVLGKKATFFFHLENCWVKKRKGGKLWFLRLYGALIFCANSATVISFDTLQIFAGIFNMVSKICCCYTHWFSGLLCCCYMLVFNAGKHLCK